MEGHFKTGHIEPTQDVDSGEKLYSFRQHGQCLEREQATTSHSVGKAGLVPAAD